MEKIKLEQTLWKPLPPQNGYVVSPVTGAVVVDLIGDSQWRINHKGLLEVSRSPMSMRRLHRHRNGTSTMELLCPWCGRWTLVYVWSFNGCGKRCSCKALLGSHSAVRSKPVYPRLHQTAEQCVNHILGVEDEVKHD